MSLKTDFFRPENYRELTGLKSHIQIILTLHFPLLLNELNH